MHIGLDSSGDELYRRGKRPGRVKRKLGHREWRRKRRIERGVLIRAVSQSILEIVVHPESRADYGLRAEWTPSHANPRLRQKLCVITVNSESPTCGSVEITPFENI